MESIPVGRNIPSDNSKPIIMSQKRSYFFPDLNFERRKLGSPKYALSRATMPQKHRPTTKEHCISQSFGGQTSHRHTTIAAGPTNRSRNSA